MHALAFRFFLVFAFGFNLNASATDGDPSLRLNHIQMKGTHNSFHQSYPLISWTPWGYSHASITEQLSLQGVRQLELDLHRCGDDDFCVYHIGFFDSGTSCSTLRECIREIKDWSSENQAHHPVFVFLEVKDSAGTSESPRFFRNLEGQILETFRRRDLLIPDDVRGQFPTLKEAVLTQGWPKIDDVRGKIVFVLLDRGDHRDHYTKDADSLQGRLMFTVSSSQRDDAAIMSIENPLTQASQIQDLVRAGYIIRTRADADLSEPGKGDYTRLNLALWSGAQIISTDVPAQTDSFAYWVEIPGGIPTRCNPITASHWCRSAQIENLR